MCKSQGLEVPNVGVGPYFCMQTDAWGMITTQIGLNVRRSGCESVCGLVCSSSRLMKCEVTGRVQVFEYSPG